MPIRFYAVIHHSFLCQNPFIISNTLIINIKNTFQRGGVLRYKGLKGDLISFQTFITSSPFTPFPPFLFHSIPTSMSLSLIKPSGDYHKLLAYQKANLVYALNNWFINNTELRFKRTQEQMEHAARSGKQNIVEGLNNYATSKPQASILLTVQ